MIVTEFMGAKAIVLENDNIKTFVLPDYGGKAASLLFRPKNFELLFQNPKGFFRKAHCGADFSAYESCGMDEAFPTVDACSVRLKGKTVRYPDHGELWSASFHAQQEGERLRLTFESPLMGYRYTKWFSLSEQGLVCDYCIENPTNQDFPALWVSHCLVRAEKDMRILLPKEVTRVQNTFTNDWLGEAKQIHTYPLSEGPRGAIDLSRMPRDGQLKFYVQEPVTVGCCGYEYPYAGVCAMLQYDAEKLPYLGFWATGGGYRGDVNCALEPASGYYDSIPLAESFGACPVLKAGEKQTFQMQIIFKSLD